MAAQESQKIAPDDARRDVRMDGVFFFRSAIDGAFVKALDPGNYSYCVMVRAGRMKLETDFPERLTIEVRAGDAVAVSGLAPHTFTSIITSKADKAGRFERKSMSRDRSKHQIELVIGVAPNEALALGSLMLGPIVVRPRKQGELSRRLWRAVDMLEDEYEGESWIDRELVIRRLAEIMLVNMTRAALAGRQPVPPGAPREPEDRQVLRAITAFFAAPSRHWTLPELARAAGMSRTRFAESFKLVTGQTPKRIISRMRLTAIARKLASAALSVESAAEEAGYSSSAAFVRAFQREFGETPARWRRRRRGRGTTGVSREAERARVRNRSRNWIKEAT